MAQASPQIWIIVGGITTDPLSWPSPVKEDVQPLSEIGRDNGRATEYVRYCHGGLLLKPCHSVRWEPRVVTATQPPLLSRCQSGCPGVRVPRFGASRDCSRHSWPMSASVLPSATHHFTHDLVRALPFKCNEFSSIKPSRECERPQSQR